MCGRDIEKSICREMSGNLESGMVAVGKCVCVWECGSLWSLYSSRLRPMGYVKVFGKTSCSILQMLVVLID